MDLRLDIQPDRFAVIVGPQFATQVVRELLDRSSAAQEQAVVPTFEFKSIVDRGVSYLLEKESFIDDAARAKFEARYSNAYELDPVFVLRKIASSLQAAGCYGEWLAELFECRLPPTASRRSSASLQRLLALQSRGALLVYVHCDEILARVAGQELLVMDDTEEMERWAVGERVGILQPHGVYSKPESVQLDCQLYDSAGGNHPLSAAMEELKRVLHRRSVVLLGDDWAAPSSDPLLANFCKRFLGEAAAEGGEVVVLNTARDSTNASPGLSINPPSPFSALYPMSNTSSYLWRQVCTPSVPSNSSQHQFKEVCLLVSSQSGARDVSHMMFNAPGVNFALVNNVTYQEAPAYSVLLRVLSVRLPELWTWLLTTSREALLAAGLLGLALHGHVFLWLRDPASALTTGDTAPGAANSENFDNTLTDTHRPNTGTNSTVQLTMVSSPSGKSGDLHSPSKSSSSSSSSSSVSPQPGSVSPYHGKIIQRYKVVKKRSGQLLAGTHHHHHHHTADGYGGLFVSKTTEEPGVMFSASFTAGSSNKYARRGSLPPIKCGETGSTLALFAERLQTSSSSSSSPLDTPSQIPSYVAIKRALLSDKFKHVQSPISRLVAPKMLLNLLQAKKLSVNPADDVEKSNLLAHRRNSDPGSYLQHRDKTRRRQLFLDENMQWIKTYSSVIDRKIQTWRQKRLLRMQREYFLQQQQMQQQEKVVSGLQSELHLMSTAKLVSGQLYATLASSTAASSLNATALPQAFVTAGGAGLNGFSSTPLMYQLPSNGLTPTPVLVPTPFLSPYSFMGGYATIPTTAPTAAAAYIVPPTALTAGPQQGMMLLPPGTTGSTATFGSPPLSTTNDVAPATKPPFSSLLAPTTKSLPVSESELETGRESTHQTVANFIGSRKRKNSLPEKLSTLLQPPSDPTDPDSPPKVKRCYIDIPGHLHTSISPPPLTSSHVTTTHEYHSSHHSSSTTHTSSHHHHSHHHHRHRHHHTHSSSHHIPSSTSPSHGHHHYLPSSPLSRNSHPHKPASPLEQCLLQPPASPCSDGGRVTDSAGESSASSPSSDYSSQPSLQLWQFLLDLLLAANCSHLIQWTNCSQEEYEFTIHRPAEVAQLWGKCTNNSTMNYDKLARGLRYYYSKGIIEKVEGKKLTFRYNGFARSYVQQRCRQTVDMTTNMEEMVVVE